jgi:hypothetical protein
MERNQKAGNFNTITEGKVLKGKQKQEKEDNWQAVSEMFQKASFSLKEFANILYSGLGQKEESEMDEKKVRAIKDSIAHWERMYKQVQMDEEKNKGYFFIKPLSEFATVVSCMLKDTIGETWSGEDCALCNLFRGNRCAECPLFQAFGICSYYSQKDNKNRFVNIVNSESYPQLLFNMEFFIKQLKSLLPEKKTAGKLVIEVLNTKWGKKLCRVKEQTFRGEDFWQGSMVFQASNRMKLYSAVGVCFGRSDYDGDISHNLVSVRGSDKSCDNDVLLVPSEAWLEKLRIAVKEYNQRQKELAGEDFSKIEYQQEDVEVIQ